MENVILLCETAAPIAGIKPGSGLQKIVPIPEPGRVMLNSKFVLIKSESEDWGLVMRWRKYCEAKGMVCIVLSGDLNNCDGSTYSFSMDVHQAEDGLLELVLFQHCGQDIKMEKSLLRGESFEGALYAIFCRVRDILKEGSFSLASPSRETNFGRLRSQSCNGHGIREMATEIPNYHLRPNIFPVYGWRQGCQAFDYCDFCSAKKPLCVLLTRSKISDMVVCKDCALEVMHPFSGECDFEGEDAVVGLPLLDCGEWDAMEATRAVFELAMSDESSNYCCKAVDVISEHLSEGKLKANPLLEKWAEAILSLYDGMQYPAECDALSSFLVASLQDGGDSGDDSSDDSGDDE